MGEIAEGRNPDGYNFWILGNLRLKDICITTDLVPIWLAPPNTKTPSSG